MDRPRRRPRRVPPVLVVMGADPHREHRLLSPAACLQIAVDFVQRDLAQLPPAGWTQLRADLDAFLVGGEHQLTTAPLVVEGRDTDGTTVFTCSPAILERLQVDLRGLLEGLVDEQGRGAGITTLTKPPRLWLLPVGAGRTLRRVDQLSVDDAIRLRLWDLLGRESSTRLRRCPEARCGHRLFYRVRRQKYCSTRCLARAMKRGKRERHQDAIRRKDKQRKAARHRRASGRTA